MFSVLLVAVHCIHNLKDTGKLKKRPTEFLSRNKVSWFRASQCEHFTISHMPVTPSWHALVLRVLEHPVTAQIKAVQTIPFPDEHRACNL